MVESNDPVRANELIKKRKVRANEREAYFKRDKNVSSWNQKGPLNLTQYTYILNLQYTISKQKI